MSQPNTKELYFMLYLKHSHADISRQNSISFLLFFSKSEFHDILNSEETYDLHYMLGKLLCMIKYTVIGQVSVTEYDQD